MYLLLPFSIFFIYSLIAKSQNESIKNYFLLSIILILPFTNNFLPPTKILSISMTPLRILVFPLLIIFPFFIKDSTRKTNFKFVASIILYLLYYLFRGFVYGEVLPTLIVEGIIFIILFIYIESLGFTFKDRKWLSYYFGLLSIFAAFVSFRQLTGDGQFYRGLSIELEKERVITAFENITRNPSIFGLFPDGSLIIGLLSIIFIFMYLKTRKKAYVVLYIVAFFTAFVTFDRSALIAPLLALMAFVYVKNKHKRNALIGIAAAAITIFLVGYTFVYLFKDTAMYQDRFLSKSYEARTETLDIFFNHLIDKNIAFGFGSEQHPDSFRKYGRGFGGSLNGFIAVYVYGGLFGLLLYLNIFRVMYTRIKAYSQRTKDYEFYVFPLSFILYNFTCSNASFYTYLSFLLFWMYFRINEQLSYKTTAVSLIKRKIIPEPLASN